jgi:CheY-like chemotaxis protein
MEDHRSLLIVDDEEDVCLLLKRSFQREFKTVESANLLEEALLIAKRLRHPLTGQQLAGWPRAKFCRKIQIHQSGYVRHFVQCHGLAPGGNCGRSGYFFGEALELGGDSGGDAEVEAIAYILLITKNALKCKHPANLQFYSINSGYLLLTIAFSSAFNSSILIGLS